MGGNFQFSNTIALYDNCGKDGIMKTKALLIKADVEPMKSVENPKPNQMYKNPYLMIDERTLGSLDPDKIRLQMIYVGVCGSDIHLIKSNPKTGYIYSSVPVDIPDEGRIIGHEGVGLVLDVGSNVKHLKKGMYVTLESIEVCNSCDVCKRGDFNQCRNAKLKGLEIDGIMGNVVDINPTIAHDVTEYIKSEKDLVAMACVEPAAVAYVACENTNIKCGDVIAIFGAGPIGAYAAMLGKSVFGASEVHVVEPVEFRRKLMSKWTEYVYDSFDSLKKNLNKVNIVIETSGDLTNVNKIFNMIDANGTVVLLARSGDALNVEAVDHMITNNIKIVGSRGHLCGAFNSLLRLHSSNRIQLDDVVTSVADGLYNLKNVLESESIENSNCKIVVNLNGTNN